MLKVEFDEKQFKDIESNLRGLEPKNAKDLLRKSVNDTVRELHAKLTREISRYIDRPKDITVKSLYAQYARGNEIDGNVEFKARAGKKIYSQHWLWPVVSGGERRDKGLERALKIYNLLPNGYKAIPSKDVRTDGHGNIPGGYVTAIISYLRADISNTQNRARGQLTARQWRTQIRRQKRFFVVRVGDVNNLSPGIYEYRAMFGGRGIRKVFSFEPVTYTSSFPFFDIARSFSQSTLIKRFTQRFEDLTRGKP